MNIPNPATLRQLVAEYLGRTPAAHDPCASFMPEQDRRASVWREIADQRPEWAAAAPRTLSRPFGPEPQDYDYSTAPWAASGTPMPCGRPTPCPGVCRCVQW